MFVTDNTSADLKKKSTCRLLVLYACLQFLCACAVLSIPSDIASGEPVPQRLQICNAGTNKTTSNSIMHGCSETFFSSESLVCLFIPHSSTRIFLHAMPTRKYVRCSALNLALDRSRAHNNTNKYPHGHATRRRDPSAPIRRSTPSHTEAAIRASPDSASPVLSVSCLLIHPPPENLRRRI
jgi:hypothetical protein